jgi:hypothetical protein
MLSPAHRLGRRDRKLTRQNPTKKIENPPEGKECLKGDPVMGRIISVTAAILLLATSWVWAGTFDVLADAGAVRTPTPLYVAPGMVVKAEFKSHVGSNSDIRTESDALLPEASRLPRVRPRPAAAYKERPAGRMVPSKQPEPAPKPGIGPVVQAEEEPDDLELDLEKDLVISPPPPKAEDKAGTEITPSVETRGVKAKARTKKKRSSVRSRKPVRTERFATSARGIRKVRPLSRANPWAVPAGNHGRYSCPVGTNQATANYQGQSYGQSYGQPYGQIAQPPTAARYVRDGVTVKLAPQPIPASYGYQNQGFEGSDPLNSALDLIGLPFAFISSFF